MIWKWFIIFYVAQKKKKKKEANITNTITINHLNSAVSFVLLNY